MVIPSVFYMKRLKTYDYVNVKTRNVRENLIPIIFLSSTAMDRAG